MARAICFVLFFLAILPIAAANTDDTECLRAFKSSVVDKNNYLASWNFNNASYYGGVCSFVGVQCWNNQLNKVLSLELDQAGLSGAFPSGLSHCTSLTILISLSGNNFKGPLPPDLCHQLPSVTVLDLSDNQFSGRIPDSSLRDCSYLNKLHLEKNFLSGEIPWELGILPRLTDLDLSSNNFSGSIPSSFTNRSAIAQQPFPALDFTNNPHLCGPPLSVTCNQRSQHVKLEIAGGAILILLLVMACAFTFISLQKGRVVCWPHSKSSATYVEMFDMHSRVTWENLQQATSGFSCTNVIGVGGSSTVYKGKLNNGKLVAIKVLQSIGLTELELDVPDIQRQFLTELEVLGKLRHRNLVRILGYCYNLDTMVIILDFMSMGSLDALLHNSDTISHDNVGHSLSKSSWSCSMRWKARFGILVGIAEGLAYLHNEYDGKHSVVHGDLKPSNVLLDEDMEPHIADFGLARMVGAINTGSIATPSRRILPGVRAWSFGYTAPECAQQGMVSRKSDVFSFGVTTLELLTGERPNSSQLEDSQTLADWVGEAITKGMVDHVIAPALKEIDWEQWDDDITAVLKLGCSCASFMPAARPDMHQVMTFLRELAHKQHLAAQSSTDALNIDHNREAELWILS